MLTGREIMTKGRGGEYAPFGSEASGWVARSSFLKACHSTARTRHFVERRTALCYDTDIRCLDTKFRDKSPLPTMTPPPSVFDELQTVLAAQGAQAACSRLADYLRGEGLYQELFDARLMQARHQFGLPVIPQGTLDDLPEPVRTRMEEAYLEACREVGGLLLGAGRVREAWMYLRPVGEKAEVAKALEELCQRETPQTPGESSEPICADQIAAEQNVVEQIIEVALYEGVCPRLGFQMVLSHYGTCNAISLFDAQMHGRPRADQQEVADVLVRHLHEELTRSVRFDIARREGREPPVATLHDLVSGRPELFENDNYHVDTTHLAAVVRFALACDDPATMRLALDLTEYGCRLSAQYQFAGQEPFADTYPAHGQFFRGLLVEGAEDAVEFFRRRAGELAETDSAAAASEVLVALLARMGRTAEALDESAARLGPGSRTTGFAPGLLELAARAEKYDRLREISRERDDPVGFAAGLLSGLARPLVASA